MRPAKADRQTVEKGCWLETRREKEEAACEETSPRYKNIGKRRKQKQYENAGAIQRRVMILPGFINPAFYLPR
ncbi:hypothetical protein KCP77_08540 [Salmonella enterica subsp. enterica]|nr:hypothetical protein KCP77_08540 [Salmonella enterica subsp. enterica]